MGCGGSLIAPGVILTAAHCAAKFQQEPTKLKIRCGEWDTQNQTEPRPHQDRYVQTLDIHPEFNPRNLANDWAVLYVNQDFDLQAHIDTVCLPQPEELFDFQTCFATGWGKDQFGAAGNYQVVLKEIDLPVVGHDQCEASLRTTRLGKRFQLDDSFICAGGVDGKDTCKGDGGSPLVCQSKFDPTSYVQAGIVAWGVGCGEDGTPGVYASVSKAACWIDYVMSCYYGQASGDFSSYWGYTTNICQNWMNTKLNDLNRQKEGAGKFGFVVQKLIDQFSKCNVRWEEPAAPLVDLSGNQRDSYGEQSATQVKEDGYSEPLTTNNDGYSEPLTNNNDGYSEPLNTNSGDNYSDNSDLTQEGDTYSEPVVKSPEPVYRK